MARSGPCSRGRTPSIPRAPSPPAAGPPDRSRWPSGGAPEAAGVPGPALGGEPLREVALRLLGRAAVALLYLAHERLAVATDLGQVVFRETAPPLSDPFLELLPLTLQHVLGHGQPPSRPALDPPTRGQYNTRACSRHRWPAACFPCRHMNGLVVMARPRHPLRAPEPSAPGLP